MDQGTRNQVYLGYDYGERNGKEHHAYARYLSRRGLQKTNLELQINAVLGPDKA